MFLLMQAQVRALRRRIAAPSTHVRALSCVLALVHLQRFCARGGVAAPLTPERLFTCVLALVFLQVALLRRCIGAEPALVRFFTRMGPLVDDHRCFLLGDKRAVPAWVETGRSPEWLRRCREDGHCGQAVACVTGRKKGVNRGVHWLRTR